MSPSSPTDPPVGSDHAAHDNARSMKSDDAAISELLFTYAERVDAGDFAGVAALFADGEIGAEGYPGVEHGAEAVLKYFERSTRRYPDGTPKTKHVMTNVIIDIDGAVAAARSYFTVLQAVPGALALQPI